MSGVSGSPVATAHTSKAATMTASESAKTAHATAAGRLTWAPMSASGRLWMGAGAGSGPGLSTRTSQPPPRCAEGAASGAECGAVAQVANVAPLAALVDAHDLDGDHGVRGAHRPADVREGLAPDLGDHSIGAEHVGQLVERI